MPPMRLLFPGTSRFNAVQIAVKGFDECTRICLTPNVCKAAEFGDCIILVRACLGHFFSTTGPISKDSTPPLLDSWLAYDSEIQQRRVKGKGAQQPWQVHWEVVVASNSQVYPELLISRKEYQ